MSEERVDKAWQKQGLGKYSVAAILGTLKHYGVAVDEEGFKTLSASKYPLQIVEEWAPRWKGTGQFSRFPFFAADELWARLSGERLAPVTYAERLAKLLGELNRMLNGAPDAKVGPGFKGLEELKAQVPQKDGKVDPNFVGEVAARLGPEGFKFFQRVSVELAKQGHADDAEEFAALEAFLFPALSGVSQALVKGMKGGADKEAATGELVTLAKDGAREPGTRLSALDSLIEIQSLPQALEVSRELFEAGEKAQDFHMALDAGQRLLWLYQKTGGNPAEAKQYEERLRKVAAEHSTAHAH